MIVTVPLGVLKRGSISFSPPLPAAKQAAIAALGMGLLDKVALVFDGEEVFWDTSVEVRADECLLKDLSGLLCCQFSLKTEHQCRCLRSQNSDFSSSRYQPEMSSARCRSLRKRPLKAHSTLYVMQFWFP